MINEGKNIILFESRQDKHTKLIFAEIRQEAPCGNTSNTLAVLLDVQGHLNGTSDTESAVSDQYMLGKRTVYLILNHIIL